MEAIALNALVRKETGKGPARRYFMAPVRRRRRLASTPRIYSNF